MATMQKQLFVLFLIALLTSTGMVNSFSISKHRSERNTDLAEALAILQRQRRRVGVEDFLNSERLLEDRPLTLDDVSDWLSRSNANDDVMRNSGVDSWMPETGSFKDFELPEVGGYMSPVETLSPTRMKASDNEVNDIFASDEDLENENEGKMEKKKKEELVNPKGDAQMENARVDLSSRSQSSPVYDANPSGIADDRGVLNSLTDEEIRVLIKAVGKLQQGEEVDAKVKKSPEMSDLDTIHDNDNVVISEPVSQEELKSVFKESNGPISKETIIVENKEPGQDVPEVIEQEIVSENLPDDSTIVREREVTNLLPQVIENEIAAAEQEQEESDAAAEEAAEEEAAAEVEEAEKLQEAAEAVESEQREENEFAEEMEDIRENGISPELYSKYLLLKKNKLFNSHHIPQSTTKRTAKRASGLYSANEVLSSDDVKSLVGNVDLTNLDTPSLIQAFAVKILSLQDEIDGLKFKNRLEDLENDELTDALNEATMGQREGSVSNNEWNSLQHAIEIEQALQDLKKKETGSDLTNVLDDKADNTYGSDEVDDFKRKRGEPWKRTNRVTDDDFYAGAIASRSPVQDFDDQRNADIERLLKSSYLMKLEDEDADRIGDGQLNEENEDETIASLFLLHADRCPAIQMYSNNCELADRYNLPVDFEARALCNLHEMCYACGHSLSVTQAQCDLVYRAAVNSLCHQKEVCVAESEIFLRTMKLKTRFIPHVQPSCRTRCTAQFMGMF